MAEIQIKAGNTIFEKDAPLTTLSLIIEGEVSFTLPMGEILLKEGDVIGLLDIGNSLHSYQYTAKTDVVVDFQPYKTLSAFCGEISSSQELTKSFLLAMQKQITALSTTYFYKKNECDVLYSEIMQFDTEYTRLCNEYGIVPKALPGLEELRPFLTEHDFEKYLDSYYADIKQIFEDDSFNPLYQKEGFMAGYFSHACSDMHLLLDAYGTIEQYLGQVSLLLINEQRLDFLDLYLSLLKNIAAKKGDIDPLITKIGKLFIRATRSSAIDETMRKERYQEYQSLSNQLKSLTAPKEPQEAKPEADSPALKATENSLVQILDYAKPSDELRSQFIQLVTGYKNQADKTSDSDALSQLRRVLTADFLELYTLAFLASMDSPGMPIPVRLFLYFGFVDEGLCSKNTTAELVEIVEHIAADENVYPFYDWLKLIYEGEAEPHKDEFERNFPAYVKSLEGDGTLSKEEAQKMLKSPTERVKFEVKNMMASGLKMTFGRPASYCPILSEHNFVKSPASCLLDRKQISQALDDILKVDFSAYHREVMFSDPALGTGREMIQKKILPRFILLPGIGMQGGLWQEIEGYNRQSPASMLLPTFCLSDINMILLRLTGEFRWEMCKRMQGARWNDVTYPSLTSEYNDYIQFYKKNNTLSTDTKQKIKQQLVKVRNRYKECFLIDYMAWVLYESKGSPRLNKVARPIFVSYCPFPREVREQLIKNPLYGKTMERLENQKNKELERINNVILRIKRNNKDRCPAEILEQAEYLQM